jgi:hypothetical protein
VLLDHRASEKNQPSWLARHQQCFIAFDLQQQPSFILTMCTSGSADEVDKKKVLCDLL